MTLTEQPLPIQNLPSRLVPCFECGYEIPNAIGERCPECGEVWKDDHQTRHILRNEISERYTKRLRLISAVWLGVLLVYAIGAEVAAGEYSGIPFAYTFFGIGFGVVMSNGLGIWLCKLGPDHQFRLHSYCWVRNLWWLHAPWLTIAAFTVFGTVLALAFRLIHQESGEVEIPIVVLIELCVWFGFSIAALVIWLTKYAEQRTEHGIMSAQTVVRFHIVYAISIWFGSGVVGFFGGVLGAMYMAGIIDPHWNDF